VGKPEEKRLLYDLGVDGRTILKLIVRKYGVEGVDWIDPYGNEVETSR
jgi:hypothetical protein